MEESIMNITKSKPSLLAIVALLVSLGWMAGCGENIAENTPTEAIESADNDQNVQTTTEVESARELAEREHEIQARLEALETRESALAERERQATEPEPVIEQPERREPIEIVQAEPEPTLRNVNVTLPASTVIEVEFLDSLSSEEAFVGDPVRVFVTRDVVQDSLVAIPAGSEVRGTVVEVIPAKKIGGQARLALDFDTLRLPAGDEVPIRSSIDYEGKRQTKKDAATIGGSAAGGAILGRVLSKDSKDKGTVIGAVVGAAIGTAVASKNATDPILIESGAITELLLYEPVRLTVLEQLEASPLAQNR
jgi:outer membrane lipoprotein SlyB